MLVEGAITDTVTGTYTFTAQFLGNVPPTPPSGTALVLGTTVNGTLTTAGQQDHYTFNLAADSNLYFDSLTNDANLRWSLSGPAGTVVSNRAFASSDDSGISNPVLALPAGVYSLTVNAAGQATGAYSFILSNLAAATTLTPGTAVSGTLSPANSSNFYQFNAAAGQTMYFAHLSAAAGRVTIAGG